MSLKGTRKNPPAARAKTGFPKGAENGPSHCMIDQVGSGVAPCLLWLAPWPAPLTARGSIAHMTDKSGSASFLNKNGKT